MAAAPRPPLAGHQLLAGLRRRPVEPAARHHLPAVAVHADAVLPRPGNPGQGHGADPAQLADRRADRPAAARARQSATISTATIATLQATLGGAEARARRARQRSSPGFGAGDDGKDAQIAGLNADLDSRAGHLRRGRWRRWRCSTSSSRRCAPRSARSKQALDASEVARHREQHADRRSRPPAQPRAGPARAGSVALPLRLLRPPARKSSKAAPTCASSATASCSSPKCCSTPGQADDLGRGHSRARQARRRHHAARNRNPARHQLGAAHRRPHRQAGRSTTPQFPSNWELSRRPRHLGRQIPRDAGRLRPTTWSPPASASSPRSTRATPTRPTSATGASSSS